MSSLPYLEQILNALTGHELVEQRTVIYKKVANLGSDPRQRLERGPTAKIRVSVASIWGIETSPIVVLLRDRQGVEDATESLGWVLGHVALGNLHGTDMHELVAATLKDDYSLPLRDVGEDVLQKAEEDKSLLAFIWAAHLLIGPQRRLFVEAGLRTEDEVNALSRELRLPPRLVTLWQDCQASDPARLYDLIDDPCKWVGRVLKSGGDS